MRQKEFAEMSTAQAESGRATLRQLRQPNFRVDEADPALGQRMPELFQMVKPEPLHPTAGSFACF